MPVESHKRSIVKAVTYRAFGFVASAGIGLLVTRNLEMALTFGVLDTVIKIFGYYFHERFWETVKWGKAKAEPPDYEI